MVTTDTSTGQVVGEQYVGTTCEGGTGGGNSGSGSGSSSSIGPYLCPSSFKYTNQGLYAGLSSANVRAGFNNIEINFYVQVNMPKLFHKDNIYSFMLAHGDIIAGGGATLQGDYYYLDEKSMRIMASRASGHAASVADESLLQFGQINYLTQFTVAGSTYLSSFGLHSTFLATPANMLKFSSNQARQIDSFFSYWSPECYN